MVTQDFVAERPPTLSTTIGNTKSLILLSDKYI